MLPCVSVKHFRHVFWPCALQDQVFRHNLKFQFSYGICIRKRLKITRTRSRSNVRRETLKKPRQPRGERSETKQKFKCVAPKMTSKLGIKSDPKKPRQPRGERLSEAWNVGRKHCGRNRKKQPKITWKLMRKSPDPSRGRLLKQGCPKRKSVQQNGLPKWPENRPILAEGGF